MNIINTAKISKHMGKTAALSALVFAFAGALVAVAPATASAYGGYGYNSYYYGGNSYYGGHNSSYGNYGHSSSNSNSNVTVSDPVTVTVPVVVNGESQEYAPVSTPIYETSPVAYDYDYPTYAPTYYNNTYAQLGGSCYAQTTTANAGQSITWIATAYGGNGNNYTYSWSGTDGLYGYGPTISYVYNTGGTMVANVTLTSGSQTVSIPCNNDVIVNGNNYNYGYSGYNYNEYDYNYGDYYNNTALEATCSANTTSANIGQPVTWSANVTGGSGYYTYVWSGSNNLYGSGPSINATYNSDGIQYADVTVSSNSGQSVTAQCTNSVNIGNVTNSNGGNGLTIGCAAGAADVEVGTPVTWSVEVTGGSGSYTYAWSGTDGLAGSQTSVATTYETPGQKQAVVIVTSSNGMTGSQSCTPITVIGGRGGNAGNGGNTNVTPTNPNTNNSGLSAASLFSLSNIPWGWVAVLIILVLFGTVMYLLFNKSKI